MFTLVILYTLVYPVSHVYLSHTVYPVYPCISCLPMFTFVILYTLVDPVYRPMFTLVILYTLVYPVYPCLPLSYCIPLYILFTHIYPSHTVYPVYPCISCLPMFTFVILYTLVDPVYRPMFTLVILYTLVYPVYPCLPLSYCIPLFTSKIQLVVYYQCCILIGWATTRLYVIAH